MPRVNYSQVFGSGPLPLLQEDLTTEVDGSKVIFSPSKTFVTNKLFVYLNGILQRLGTEVSSNDGISFTMNTAPQNGSILYVMYQPK